MPAWRIFPEYSLAAFCPAIPAAPADPSSIRSNTSTARAHGTTVHRGSIRSAASWLNDPNSPWIATFISSFLKFFFQEQLIHTVGIVTRQGPDHAITVPFV